MCVELCRLTFHVLRDLILIGVVSPVRVVQDFLVRIGQVEDQIQAFNTLTPRLAVAFAKKFEEMQGRKEKLPPLAGVPLAIKDVICTKGVATTCSSRILENYIPPYNATVMARLNAAGALMLGKTNLDEFAMGSSTENSAFKKTRNPWNLGCVPGGSSGGSAAAVAAEMCAGALGSDTGGSIRQPGGFCGIVALKPTYGRVSRYGLVAFASSLDQIGPMTKDVRDAAILLKVIAVDPLDSTSASIPVPDYEAALTGEIKGLRVGIPAEFSSPAWIRRWRRRFTRPSVSWSGWALCRRRCRCRTPTMPWPPTTWWPRPRPARISNDTTE
jgi:aspartyl-tRNA(Asn)/glutamyl-tRNA(Gln) amidotransferase subunit A